MHPHCRHSSLLAVTSGNQISRPNLSCSISPCNKRLQEQSRHAGGCNPMWQDFWHWEWVWEYREMMTTVAFIMAMQRWWLPQPSSCLVQQQTLQLAWPESFLLFNFFFSQWKLLCSNLCPSWALSFSKSLEILFYTSIVGMGDVFYHRHFLDNINSLAMKESQIHTPIWYPPEGNVHNQIWSSCCWAINWNTEGH